MKQILISKQPSLVEEARKFEEVGDPIASRTYKKFDSSTCHRIFTNDSEEQGGIGF